MTREDHFSIRKAVIDDAPGILRCLRSAFGDYEDDYTPDAFHDTVLDLPSLGQRMTRMTLLVALDPHGNIVGTVGLERLGAAEGHIRGMAVLPEWQGRGVAQSLLEAAEAELVLHDCSCMTLDTTEPLERAMRFYERNGFKRSEEVGEFFGMPLIRYVKALR